MLIGVRSFPKKIMKLANSIDPCPSLLSASQWSKSPMFVFLNCLDLLLTSYYIERKYFRLLFLIYFFLSQFVIVIDIRMYSIVVNGFSAEFIPWIMKWFPFSVSDVSIILHGFFSVRRKNVHI